MRAALAADGALAPFRSVALRLAPTDEAAVAPALEALRSEFDGRVAVGSYPVGPMDWRLCAQPCLDAAPDARVGVEFHGGMTVGSYPVGLPARRLHTRPCLDAAPECSALILVNLTPNRTIRSSRKNVKKKGYHRQLVIKERESA